MAVVSDRKQAFLREIETLNHQKRQLVEQVLHGDSEDNIGGSEDNDGDNNPLVF